MALVDSPLAAFAELRFRLAWRRLRGRGGVPDLVARLASFLVILPAGVALAGLTGVGVHKAARASQGLLASTPLNALFFGIWQAWTAVALSMQEQEALDLRRFLVYPLPAARLYLSGLVASVVGDPFALFWCLLLGGAWIGAAAARPGGWLLALALVLVLFAAASAVFVALLQEAMARLLRGRRTREVLITALYVGVAFLVAALAGMRKPADLHHLLHALATIQWLAWPAALAAAAARHLFAGQVVAALPWILGLALATAVAARLAFRLALAEARSGGPAAARVDAGSHWSLAALAGRLGPLLELEVKHLLRHPLPGVLLLVVPALAAFLAWKVSPLIPEEAGEVVRAVPLLGFALYTHLATQVFWLNAFGWDRGGARLLFLAPLAPEQVLVAKNAAAYALSGALYLACAALTVLVAGAPPAWALLAAGALHAGLAPALYGLGNLVSVLNPRAASPTLQRSGSLPPLSALAGMLIVSGAAAAWAVPVLAAVWWDQPWLLPGGWAAMGAAAWAAYRATLPRTGRLLSAQREPLLAAVTGDEP